MVTQAVDFTSQEYLRDPVAGIERLRRLGPLVQVNPHHRQKVARRQRYTAATEGQRNLAMRG